VVADALEDVVAAEGGRGRRLRDLSSPNRSGKVISCGGATAHKVFVLWGS
jgi:hypothetical protein